MVNQGDIIKVEQIKYPLFVVSKDTVNKVGFCIAVPFVKNCKENALHIKTSFSNDILMTEQLRYVDLNSRNYRIVGRLELGEIANIIDIVQGIFDYY